MLNENITVAFIVAIPPTLAVVASTVISLKTIKAQNQKQNTKLDEIHDLTNSNFTKANEKIDRLQAVITKNAEDKLEEAEAGSK